MIFKSKLRASKSLATTIRLVSIIILIAVTGCNDDYEEPINSFIYDDIDLLTMNYSDLKNIKGNGFYWNSDEANLIGVKFLKLNVNNNYTFSMTYQDAIELHIHKSDYERMIRELKLANDSIDKWSRDKNIVLDLPNPQAFISSKLQINKMNIRLKSSNVEEQKPGERTVGVSSNGQDWGSTSWWLPYDAVIPLKVSCHSPSTFTPLFIIKARTCGNDKITSGVGLNGTWNTTITPHCSNTTCTFSFQTSSTNGGIATVKY